MTQLVFEPSQTTHWKNLFPNKMLLLGSQNLNEGEELIAKIKAVHRQQVKDKNGKDEEVSVVQFENAPPMVLNITNARTIANLYGELYSNWVGCSLQIYATKVKAFGQEQMALRIREAIPNVGQDTTEYENALRACTTMADLQKVFMDTPKHIRPMITATKDEMKGKLSEKS